MKILQGFKTMFYRTNTPCQRVSGPIRHFSSFYVTLGDFVKDKLEKFLELCPIHQTLGFPLVSGIRQTLKFGTCQHLLISVFVNFTLLIVYCSIRLKAA